MTERVTDEEAVECFSTMIELALAPMTHNQLPAQKAGILQRMKVWRQWIKTNMSSDMNDNPCKELRQELARIRPVVELLSRIDTSNGLSQVAAENLQYVAKKALRFPTERTHAKGEL